MWKFPLRTIDRPDDTRVLLGVPREIHRSALHEWASTRHVYVELVSNHGSYPTPFTALVACNLTDSGDVVIDLPGVSGQNHTVLAGVMDPDLRRTVTVGAFRAQPAGRDGFTRDRRAIALSEWDYETRYRIRAVCVYDGHIWLSTEPSPQDLWKGLSIGAQISRDELLAHEQESPLAEALLACFGGMPPGQPMRVTNAEFDDFWQQLPST